MENKISKGRRVRANRAARKREDADFLARMGPMPEHLKQRYPECSSFAYPPEEPYQRAPAHVLDPDGLPEIDISKIRDLSYQAGIRRTEERRVAMNGIEEKYPDLIRKRGGARLIVLREAKEGREISLRTVQRYLSEMRSKN